MTGLLWAENYSFKSDAVTPNAVARVSPVLSGVVAKIPEPALSARFNQRIALPLPPAIDTRPEIPSSHASVIAEYLVVNAVLPATPGILTY